MISNLEFLKKFVKKYVFIFESVKKAKYAYYWKQKNYDSYKIKYSLCCEKKDLLSPTQKNEIRNFWGGYGYFDTILHEFYYQKTGEYFLNYIPDDLFIHEIERYYNDWHKAEAIENKCYFEQLYPNVKQPKTFAKRQNNIWTDENGELISDEKLLKNIKLFNDELFLKYATDSFGGQGVFCINQSIGTNEIEKYIKENKRDIIIQYGIKQHQILYNLNPSSVNTIRIMSLLRNNEVKIYSSVLRMGNGKARVDNSCSGGISVGVFHDGHLKSRAYDAQGNKFEEKHPKSNVKFDTVVIPNYDKVVELIKKAHPMTPYFGLISWDIAIDEKGYPVLVEAGYKYGELYLHQLNNGPIFGEDTKEILAEVFGK